VPAFEFLGQFSAAEYEERSLTMIPVCSKHFMETISSLPTLRSFAWTAPKTNLASSLIDQSQRPAYLLAMLTQWLNTVLNMSVAAVAVVFVSLATQLRTSAGFTGVGLVSLMSFAQMLGDLIRNYAELQTATAALARLKTFEEGAGDEDAGGEKEIPQGRWPNRGLVRFEEVSASYGKDQESVLKNISLEIASGEKILVCGRTGR
jgi:ABC-type multidrug transport system fused ATPase/permease subunit